MNESKRKRFNELADKWLRETGGYSVIADMIKHESYQEILKMGDEVVPCIIRKMAKDGGHWFSALYTFVGENPVPYDDAGYYHRMVEAWVEWAKSEGLVEEDLEITYSSYSPKD